MIRHWSHARQKGWGYPPKKTACQSGLRFQRYKPLKSVTTAGRPAGRPLILRFLVYISRHSLRASRSLVTSYINSYNFSLFRTEYKDCLFIYEKSFLFPEHCLLIAGIKPSPGGHTHPHRHSDNQTTSAVYIELPQS